jgi:hypothetical protein
VAERRMFAKSIIDSDAFLEMPLSTQSLYFHLAMRADDDGFVNNPKKIVRMLGTGEDELKVLFSKKFIIGFESGVIVIKHWKIHNYIQKDRYNPTKYIDELTLLATKDNKSYTMDTKCIQDGYTGKVRLGKVSLDKDSIVEVIEAKKVTPDDKLTNDIIQKYETYFKKTYRLDFNEKIEICHITNQEQYTLEDWELIFKNASKGWNINNENVKPSLSNILKNYSKFLNDDYNLHKEVSENKILEGIDWSKI